MNKEQQEEYKEKRLDQICNMIMSQTDYSYDEAKTRLVKENYNYLNVIKKYIQGENTENVTVEKKPETKTVNQQIYGELRNFMDKSSEQYEKRKKKAEKMEEFKKKLQEEYERRVESGEIQENKSE